MPFAFFKSRNTGSGPLFFFCRALSLSGEFLQPHSNHAAPNYRSQTRPGEPEARPTPQRQAAGWTCASG